MINKENFVKLIKFLQRDEEYKIKLNNIVRKYEQGNSYCFTNNDFSKAFDILLREALDDTEWMYDCVWGFILEDNGKLEFYRDDKTKVVCDSPEKLYDFFVET